MDTISGRVKQSIEDVDWDELRSKKEAALQKVKKRTNEYKDDVLVQTKSIKENVKQSIEDVDWDELRAKKEAALQKAKKKTNEYKDDVLIQTKAIKEKLDKKYKNKKGGDSHQKDKEVDEKQKSDSILLSSDAEVEGLSKEDYLDALEKLKKRDRIGLAGDILATSLASAGGVAGAGAVASMAGASTLLGSSALGTALGGVVVTATPVGWVIGCAVVAGAAGYGLTRVVRSGEKQDVARKKYCDQILKKVKSTNPKTKPKPKSGDRYDEFINLVMASLEKDLITREMSQQLIKMVESGSLSVEVAILRLDELLKCSQVDT